jgi:hypothetical protein
VSPPELSRRAALTVVVAGLAVGGCDLAPGGTPPDAAPPTASPDERPGVEEDPDVALVETIRGEIGATLALVTAASGRPALRRELAAWRRLHRQHLDAFPGEASQAPGTTVSGSAARLRARVLAREEQLQGTLAGAAIEADSGSLATLLASMSAAVAQQLSDSGGGR